MRVTLDFRFNGVNIKKSAFKGIVLVWNAVACAVFWYCTNGGVFLFDRSLQFEFQVRLFSMKLLVCESDCGVDQNFRFRGLCRPEFLYLRTC